MPRSRVSASRRFPLSFLLALAVLALGIAAPRAGSAQIPDEFMNLKVLPEDISKADLVQTMRGFAGALGVRCTHCHATKEGVDPASDDLKDLDFVSDAREAKVTAREMIKMVRAINSDYLAKLPGGAKIEVRCESCHRGVAEPELLDDRVARIVKEEGAAAAVADYRELRQEYYGSGAYDFGQRPLNRLGERMLRAGNAADAKALLALNAELNPEADRTLTLLGEAQLATGEKDAARATFKKVLELDPESEQAKRRLAELSSPPPEAAEPKPEPPKPPR